MRVVIAYSDQRPGADTDLHAAVNRLQMTLQQLGHPVTAVPLGLDVPKFQMELRDAQPELIWNLCEEACGLPRRELHAAALLELLDVPVTGTGAVDLALCLDKSRVRHVLAGEGVRVPAAVRVAHAHELPAKIPLPALVKPACQDGSTGIHADSLVHDVRTAHDRVERLLRADLGPVLVEQFVAGREINVLMLGPHGGPLHALAYGEIDFSALPQDAPQILTWEAKWEEESPVFLQTPVNYPAVIEPQLQQQIATIAHRAFRTLGLEGYARLDLRVDAEGVAYVIDVNPNPDLSPGAGLDRALPTLGLQFADFVALQLQWARVK